MYKILKINFPKYAYDYKADLLRSFSNNMAKYEISKKMNIKNKLAILLAYDEK